METYSLGETIVMFNDRPIEDPRLAAALQEILDVYATYDLLRGCHACQ